MLPVLVVLVALWRASGRPVRWRGCGILVGVMAAVWLVGYRFDPAVFSRDRLSTGARGRRAAAFLFGQIASHGWWCYYAAAFAVKTPIALLALLGASAVLLVRHRETLVDDGFLILSLAVLGFFSVEHQESIGLRYILPIYPFLIVPWPAGRRPSPPRRDRAKSWSGSRSPGAPFHHSGRIPTTWRKLNEAVGGRVTGIAIWSTQTWIGDRS